jgi:hypothetical protein
MVDISDDPCFRNPPTWGICRPPTRKVIDKGDYLFFFAYYKISDQYYFKGYFKVGEKISYINAFKRFKNRLNVIITDKKYKNKNANWRYRDLKKTYENKNGTQIKKWLTTIQVQEGIFYQNPNDNHEIDNWKCRRIFHCQSDQFKNCILRDKCLKDKISLMEYKNYVVADNKNWADLGHLWIDLPTFLKETGFSLSLKTPLNQHNVLKCDDYLKVFLGFIDKKLSKKTEI